MSTHLFGGVWCAPVANYALRRTVLDCPDVPPLLAHAVNDCMYVDDCLMSVSTRDDVVALVRDLPQLLLTGGFTLTKFVVNDPDFIELVPEEHRAKEVHQFLPTSIGRTLGVEWNIHNDAFRFQISVSSSDHLTHRHMLTVVASIFDPLGLTLPWVMAGKVILQQATELKLGWDEPVRQIWRPDGMDG
jgi:hypothetical protein